MGDDSAMNQNSGRVVRPPDPEPEAAPAEARAEEAPARDVAPGPVYGPCEAWITVDDVGCDAVTDADVLAAMAQVASDSLFEISGRQFTGLCEKVVRPCSDPCSCWGPSSLGLGPWNWSTYPNWGVGSWGWRNEVGDRFGCKPMSRVRLAGYPVRAICEVLIDGVVLDPTDSNNNPNYRLDRYRDLIRMDDPGPPEQSRLWPGCQNLSFDPDQSGTFQITYLTGMDPPQAGIEAAKVLACELAKSVAGLPCHLPTGTTRITRQGVTVERGVLANWFDPTKPTGIPVLDVFLRAYYEIRTGRRPAVWSPDVQSYARPQGISGS